MKKNSSLLTREDLPQILASTLKARVPILLYGPPGTGKTELARAVCQTLGSRYAHLTLPEDAMVAEARGHRVPDSDGAWIWVDGPVLEAYRLGLPVILDELDHAAPELQTWLHQVLDMTSLTLPTKETVICATSFAVIATMNGTPDVQMPLYNRFAVRLHIKEPLARTVDALEEPYRTAAVRDWSPQNPSTRLWYAMSRLTAHLGDSELAAELIFPGRSAELLDAMKLAK